MNIPSDVLQGLPIVLLLSLGVSAAWAPTGAQAQGLEPEWNLFLYGGQWTDNRYGEITLSGETRLRRSYLWVAGVSRSLVEFHPNLVLEGEWNLTRHSGQQDHFEVNSALSLRWNSFPWDSYVNTTFAHGIGPSYAFDRPPIEESSDERAERMLLFMQTELTFSPPNSTGSPWALIFRIHHRSGVFGLVSDASGSNFLAVGVRLKLP